MTNYQSLLNILDKIRFKSPKQYKFYRPVMIDIEKVNQARARAFIHLFLKVKYGLLDFREREIFICDGPYDGGIDGYFIDTELKKIMFIQSKFRTTKKNFEEKEIALDELLRMDVDRITDGETNDEDGNSYNGKIKGLQREMKEIADIGRYSYEIIILANLKKYKPSDIKKLVGGFSATVFDHKKVYNELLFPVVSGNYYNQKELHILLNLQNKNSASARISYNVITQYSKCDITVVFVPVSEIGRILYKYKNSILKSNPRCFLELSNNPVNKQIHSTITDLQTNEFSLFNNGITMLSDATEFNEKIGQKDKAQIVVTNPQIINGGQTAYTLSRVYEDILNGEEDENIFENKEVLLKIITFDTVSEKQIDKKQKLELIENISKATNQQTSVSEADRRSNDLIQIEIQDELFDKYGLFYERKRGEFSDGLREKYISKDLIIDREIFIRLCKTCDFLPSQARRTGAEKLFSESGFSQTLNNVTRVEEYYFAYLCYQELLKLEKELSADKKDRYGTANYGLALRYGKFAVVTVCVNKFYITSNSFSKVQNNVLKILRRWLKFEEYIVKRKTNKDYFYKYKNPETNEWQSYQNFDGYYKGRTLNNDLKKYFIK